MQTQGFKGSIATNTDKVISAIALPRGGVFHGCRIHVNLRQLEQVVAKLMAYGLTGYFVPVLDPDAAAAFDTIWDTQVPKDRGEAANIVDLDTGTSVSVPEYEPGGVNWTAVLDLEHGPRLAYRRRRIIGAPRAGVFATGTQTHYLPQEDFTFDVKGGYRAQVPTVLMFAVSSPVISGTTITALTSPSKQEWYQLRYLEDTAIDAMKWLMGMTEAGAESPYEEAAVFLDKTLRPQWVEEVATEFATGTWEVYAESHYTMSVPGTIRVRLDGDR